jgi:hypothetical protein
MEASSRGSAEGGGAAKARTGTGADHARSGSRGKSGRLLSGTGNTSMTVAVIDYGSGNLHSAAKALERASRESGAAEPILVTNDPDAVRRADTRQHDALGARRIIRLVQ